jgi:ribonuclease HI
MLIEIATDGSTLNNPGPGGWACIFKAAGYVKCLRGYEDNTTNNRMELTAALEGLKHLKYPCTVKLYCDSEYVIKGITRWISGWKKKNFRGIKTKIYGLDLMKQRKVIRLNGSG